MLWKDEFGDYKIEERVVCEDKTSNQESYRTVNRTSKGSVYEWYTTVCGFIRGGIL